MNLLSSFLLHWHKEIQSFLCIQVLESFSLVDLFLIVPLTLSLFDLEYLSMNLFYPSI